MELPEPETHYYNPIHRDERSKRLAHDNDKDNTGILSQDSLEHHVNHIHEDVLNVSTESRIAAQNKGIVNTENEMKETTKDKAMNEAKLDDDSTKIESKMITNSHSRQALNDVNKVHEIKLLNRPRPRSVISNKSRSSSDGSVGLEEKKLLDHPRPNSISIRSKSNCETYTGRLSLTETMSSRERPKLLTDRSRSLSDYKPLKESNDEETVSTLSTYGTVYSNRSRSFSEGNAVSKEKEQVKPAKLKKEKSCGSSVTSLTSFTGLDDKCQQRKTSNYYHYR